MWQPDRQMAAAIAWWTTLSIGLVSAYMTNNIIDDDFVVPKIAPLLADSLKTSPFNLPEGRSNGPGKKRGCTG